MHSKVDAEKFVRKHVLTDVFSRADCEELDGLARRGQPKEFTPLTDQMLRHLQMELEVIASKHQAQQSVWYLSTASKRLRHAAAARKRAISLLKSFGLTPDSKPKDLNVGHYFPGGVFEHYEADPNSLIRSLLNLVDLCDERIRKETKNIENVEPARQNSETNQLLVGRLVLVYKYFWGDGDIGNTVDDQGRGGPGVRFVQAAASKICGKRFQSRTISHLIDLVTAHQPAASKSEAASSS